MADIFISYARPTESSARLIADAALAEGYSVWFDEDLPAHRAYTDVISEQLENAKAVVVIWSAQAAASHWVRSEANRAREKGTLVQVSVDGSRLPMPFDQIQYVDLRGWRGDESATAWRKLKCSLAELARGESSTDVRDIPARRASGGVARRPLLMGAGAALVLGAAGFFAFSEMASGPVSPEVQLLLQKAFTIMQDGRPAEQEQAIAYLVEATRLAPDHAPGWGALALTYALHKFQVPVAARPGEEARCRSAARTALGLDPDEPFASCALVLLTPQYKNWRNLEKTGQLLAGRFPRIPLAIHLLGDLLADVGRWREANDAYRKIDRTKFLIPLSDRSIILSLWSSGEIQAAEALLDEAARRWPQHYALWNLRVEFLTHSGRADEAIRLLENPSGHPPNHPDELLRSSLVTARAIAGTVTRDVAIRENLSVLNSHSTNILTYLNRKVTLGQLIAQRCSSLGDNDTAFALLDGYYFGRGPWAELAPAAGNQDRTTIPLFEPPMSKAWKDRRFVALVNDIGLEEYWRTVRVAPDFRGYRA